MRAGKFLRLKDDGTVLVPVSGKGGTKYVHCQQETANHGRTLFNTVESKIRVLRFRLDCVGEVLDDLGKRPSKRALTEAVETIRDLVS